MASLLSNLVNSLAAGIHRIKCKHEDDTKQGLTLQVIN